MSRENLYWFSPIKFNVGRADPDQFFIALLYRYRGSNIIVFTTDSAVTSNTSLEIVVGCGDVVFLV